MWTRGLRDEDAWSPRGRRTPPRTAPPIRGRRSVTAASWWQHCTGDRAMPDRWSGDARQMVGRCKTDGRGDRVAVTLGHGVLPINSLVIRNRVPGHRPKNLAHGGATARDDLLCARGK